jgi:hypothetical protein
MGHPDPAPVFPRWWELLLIVLVATVVLFGVIRYYDDVHRATTNGLWKSLDVTLWVEGSPERFTEGSNVLYYPVIGALVRALPSTFGTVWQRMAYVNALLGAVVLALTYAIALRLFRSRATALVACLAQLAMGFFLLLTTINEDIMPGYLWFVAAVACAVLPRRLGAWAVVLTAQCVALAWLFHSSLQLPAIGAFVAGIAAWAGDVRQAAWRVVLFVEALVPLPLVSAWIFELPWRDSFWSGKGLGTGWGGFAANKIVFLWGGMGQAVAGGQNLGSVAELVAYPQVVWSSLTTIAIATLFIVWLRAGWRQRTLPEWRLAVAVLGVVFVLGEAMNLYVQPQDPQMQIQPMTWFPLAVACMYCGIGFWNMPSAARRTGVVTALALLMAANIRAHADSRHADSRALASIRTIESLVPRHRTMFLVQGFEGLCTWLTVGWGRGAGWPGSFEGPTPPRPVGGGFNGIYITNELVYFPDRTPADAAENIVKLVDHALDEGFEVVASDIWSLPESAWVESFSTVSDPDRPRAIRAALHERYAGTLIGTVPSWTGLYRLERKTGDQPSP